MLEVLDDAINLRDERDAPLTLSQWLRCKRKKISSPVNRLPLNQAGSIRAVTVFTSRSCELRGRAGEGTSSLCRGTGAAGFPRCCENTNWLLLFHWFEPGGWLEQGVQTFHRHREIMEPATSASKTVSRGWLGNHIHCQEQLSAATVCRDLSSILQTSGLYPQDQKKQGWASQQLRRWLNSQL